jgi:hypothetical protein
MNKEFWRGDKLPFRFQYLILPMLVFVSIRHAKTEVEGPGSALNFWR